MSAAFFAQSRGRPRCYRFHPRLNAGRRGRLSWIAVSLVLAGSTIAASSTAADKPANLHDVDVKDVADLEKMSADAVRKIVITKTPKEMTPKDVAVTKAVYSARLNTEIEFDQSKKCFVVAKRFHTRDAAMQVVLNIAEPNAVSFAGVLAVPHSTAEGSKEKGYRVVLKADISTVFPGNDQRDAIGNAIATDEEAPLPEPEPRASAPAQKNVAHKAPAVPVKKAAAASLVAAPAINPVELPDLDFGAAADNAHPSGPVLLDRDETPEGRRRIDEITARARTLFRNIDETMDKRRPFVMERDQKVGKFTQAEAEIIADQQTRAGYQMQAMEVRQMIAGSTGNVRGNLQNQLAALNNNINALTTQIDNRIQFQKNLLNRIGALNTQITPFDQRLVKLWAELNEARQQWLEQRQPMEKYTRGDFELLRRVLDDWLVIDGLWQNAFAWAALCSYELHEFEKAADYLEKAQKVPDGVHRSRRDTAQLSALTGLVRGKQQGQSDKARQAITIALRDVDKKSGWETHFLVGRFYADRPPELSRARAQFEMALKIRPNCRSAQLWLARVQTIASSEKVRDLPSAIKTLETLWESTGKRSWRIAYFLFEALHGGGRTDDAARFWDKAMELAPPERHKQLQADRKLVVEAGPWASRARESSGSN